MASLVILGRVTVVIFFLSCPVRYGNMEINGGEGDWFE